MLEWESCWGDLANNMDTAEQCIKYCASQLVTKCKQELEILNKVSINHNSKLSKIINQPFIRITHHDAITLLFTAHKVTPFIIEPSYTDDLSGEHEKHLVKHYDHPVFVMYYPKSVKAFYMPIHHQIEQDNNIIEYVDCFDLLMDIGEVVGGSQRIWSESELVQRMADCNISGLDWYIDLRRFGSVPHGGAGLGVERLVATLSGTTNVKDCISFPITVNHCAF